MEANEIIFEVLEATGLNWTASKQPLYFNLDNSPVEVGGQFAVVRSDNSKPLAVVGNNYQILQNQDMVGLAYEAGKEVFDQNGIVNHPWNNAATLGSFGNLAGGSLKDGQAVFCQLQLPDGFVGKSGIKRFISLTNHHDGTKSLGFGTTNQVICCANTFAIANKELSKIRHTASMTERINEAVVSLRRMLDFEESQMRTFEKAAKIPIMKTHIREVMETMFGKNNLDNPKASTRLQNQVTAYAYDLEKSIDEQGETLWALFNSVTRFTNHTRNVKNKDYSLLFGVDAKTNTDAFSLIESYTR